MMVPLSVFLLVVCILLFMLLNRISRKAYCIFVIIAFALVLAFYIQGTFLASALPEMDGDTVIWSTYSYQRPWSIILWSLATVLTVIMIKFSGRIDTDKKI